MIQDNLELETSKKQNLSSEKIDAMRKKAMETGARPVKLEAIIAQSCTRYYVGCDTIEANRKLIARDLNSE